MVARAWCLVIGWGAGEVNSRSRALWTAVLKQPFYMYQIQIQASLVAQTVKPACNAGATAADQSGLSCPTLCDLTDCSPPGSSVHGHWGSIPVLGRFPGDENSCLLPYSRLENPTDRGVSWATVHGVTKELDVQKNVLQRRKEMEHLMPTICQALGCEHSI